MMSRQKSTFSTPSQTSEPTPLKYRDIIYG
jgi:hypothetical protein